MYIIARLFFQGWHISVVHLGVDVVEVMVRKHKYKVQMNLIKKYHLYQARFH